MRYFIFICWTALVVACSGSNQEDDDWSAGLQNISAWDQVDRMGNPLINVVLIDDSTDKDDFNFFDPVDDVANFKTLVEAKTKSLRDSVSPLWGVADTGAKAVSLSGFSAMVLPDVLTIDLAKDTVYPNGRGLADDASDLLLGLLFNYGNVLGGGTGVSDGITSALKISDNFPYVAAIAE